MPMDDALRDELEQMRAADQALREEAMRVVQEHGMDSPHYAELRTRGRAQDAKHVARLVEILDEQGWPGKRRVGDLASSGAFLVLQHADVAVQEKYLPMARQAAKSGEFEPALLALLEDRVLMTRGKKQLYGSQLTRGPDGKPRLWPIADEESVHERRASMGMEPLAAYLKRFGLEAEDLAP